MIYSQIGDGSQQDIPNSAVEYAGKMITADQVKCDLPESPVSTNTSMAAATAHGFKLSISNDGTVFSSPQLLTVFDPKCMACQSGGTCHLKVTFLYFKI